MDISKIIIVLLLLTNVKTQQTESSLYQNQEPLQENQFFSFQHQCSLSDASSQNKQSREDGIGNNIMQFISKVYQTLLKEWQQLLSMLPWMYIVYKVGFAFLLSQQHCYENLPFTYTIISLVEQIHFGTLYMLYCNIFEDTKMKGIVFLVIITAISSWRIVFVFLLGKPTMKEGAVLALIAFSLTCILFWWTEYFELILQLIYTYLHYDFVFAEKVKFQDQILINHLLNSTFFSLQSWSPVILISHITFSQMLIFVYFNLFMIIFKPKIIRRHMAEQLARLYHKILQKILGKKPNTDLCAICWQEMEIYAGFYEITDFKHAFGKSLVRVHKNHFFHASCLFLWSLEKNTCPLDNQEIDLY